MSWDFVEFSMRTWISCSWPQNLSNAYIPSQFEGNLLNSSLNPSIFPVTSFFPSFLVAYPAHFCC